MENLYLKNASTDYFVNALCHRKMRITNLKLFQFGYRY